MMRLLPLWILACFLAHADTRLDWDASAGATEYHVALGTNSRAYTQTFITTGTSLVLTGLTSGTYYAVVTAHNASQACPWQETSDPSDDPVELSFDVTVREVVVVAISTTDSTLPRSKWREEVTIRAPWRGDSAVYALKILTTPSATLNASRTGAALAPAEPADPTPPQR